MRGRTSSSGTALKQPAGTRSQLWCSCPLRARSTQGLASACTQRWGMLVAFSTKTCSTALRCKSTIKIGARQDTLSS